MPTSARRSPRLALAGGGGRPPIGDSPALREALRFLQLSRAELVEEVRRDLEATASARDAEP